MMFNGVVTLILFGSFVSHSLALCNLSAKILRVIKNDGFHKELVYKVDIYAPHISGLMFEECSLYTEEYIPSSFYVDPNQLADLSRLGKASAKVDQDVNIELPESKSLPHTASIYSTLISPSSDWLTSSFYLPIHVRYHAPKIGGGYRRSSLDFPTVYINCTENIMCGHAWASGLTKTDNKCLFQKLKLKFSGDQYVDIPVGNLSHTLFIKYVTFVVVSLGCLYILKAILTQL